MFPVGDVKIDVVNGLVKEFQLPLVFASGGMVDADAIPVRGVAIVVLGAEGWTRGKTIGKFRCTYLSDRQFAIAVLEEFDLPERKNILGDFVIQRHNSLRNTSVI